MKKYQITIGTGTIKTHSEIVIVEDYEHEHNAIDNLIDRMEKRGDVGFFATNEEIEDEDYGVDEYVIGGNHCLNLMHYGTFNIELIEESEEK